MTCRLAALAIVSLLPAAPAAAQLAIPAPSEHRWDGHPPLYQPRLDFLAELDRWVKTWAELFPADRGAPTPGLQRLGAELVEFRRSASQGMTVAELAGGKAAFKDWQARLQTELCALPAAAHSGQDCRKAGSQLRAAVESRDPRRQQEERRRIAALAGRLDSASAAQVFDNGGRGYGSVTAPVSAPASRPRYGAPAAAAPSWSLPALAQIPAPAPAGADQAGPVDALLRAIQRFSPLDWDGRCLHYVWDALIAVVQTDVRRLLGWAAESAHSFLRAIRRVPGLLGQIRLRRVDPVAPDGSLALQKGMTLFYDRGVCGYDEDYGHAEIVTYVDSSGRALATSSNVETVRTKCLKRALAKGLAMVVVPGL